MHQKLNKNFAAKILALILAFVLWVYVTNEQNPPVETTLTVPLETRNITAPLVAVDLPDAVKVKLRGSRSLIAGLRPQDVKCYVDLKGLSEGRHSAKVYALVPTGLELIEVSPDKVQIRLDSTVSKKLPAQIKLTGTATAGTAVARIAAVPEQVTIEGPRTAVEAVDKVVIPLDLTGKNADFEVAVGPVLLDNEGKAVEGLIVYPDKITLTVNLVRGLSQKIVEIRPLVHGEPAAGTELRSIAVNPGKITVSGDKPVLEQLEFIYTEPVNIAGLSQNAVKEAKLQLKEGVLASQNTVTVNITVGTGR